MKEWYMSGKEERDVLYNADTERLRVLANRAVEKGLSTRQFVVVLIDVDDTSWTDLVDHLMPNHNWQEYRDRGEKPIARGTVLAEIVEYINMVVPDIAKALEAHYPEGHVRVIVMGSGGASVYLLSLNSGH